MAPTSAPNTVLNPSEATGRTEVRTVGLRNSAHIIRLVQISIRSTYREKASFCVGVSMAQFLKRGTEDSTPIEIGLPRLGAEKAEVHASASSSSASIGSSQSPQISEVCGFA